jgi:two-component system chemotaxis response regulator CheB
MATPTASITARDIIVIGGSAGGIAALSEIVQALPRDFPAAVFVVLHVSKGTPSLLGSVLDRLSMLPVRTALDGSPIEPGTITVAPSDQHMTLDGERVRVAFGPLQNRSRPSVDVLFRSAALCCGPRVVGVVLTGFLSDGAAGLREIKRQGGIAVVQDPDSAPFPDMPKNALRATPVDHCVALEELPGLLVRLTAQVRESELSDPRPSPTQLFEAGADLGEVHDIESVAKPSSFLCPDCGGALWELNNDDQPRYRCRVGHGYSAETLVAGQDAAVETALWAATRILEDRAALFHRLADAWRKREAPAVLQHFEREAHKSSNHAATLRSLLGMAAVTDPE